MAPEASIEGVVEPPTRGAGAAVADRGLPQGGLARLRLPRALRGRPTSALRRFLAYLAVAGPGLVAANAGNDAGGVATYASAGAQFGYRTLFLVLVVTVSYAVIQEMTARLAAHTGKGLAALVREELSVRFSALMTLAFAAANIGLVVTEFAGIALALGLFGVPRGVSVPVAAIAIWVLVVFGSYRYAERVFLVMSLAFLAYPITMVLGHPEWGKVTTQLLWPHFVATHDFVVLAVALVGTTITPYIQLYEAGAVVDRGIGPDEYRFERIDAVGGAIFSDMISVCIIVATAAVVGGHGPLSSAAQAARAFRPLAGGGAEVLFAIGLLGASALAAAVVPLSTSYALAEALGVERSVSRSFSEAPVFLGLFSLQLVIGAAIVLVPGNLISLIVNTQVLEGLITPLVLGVVVALSSRRSLLGQAANGVVARVLGWASVVGIGSLALVVVGMTVASWI
jgi:Mn2+/Fe2+ NRAMP family transporter